MRGNCDGRLQNWPGIANERPKFLAMEAVTALLHFGRGLGGANPHTTMMNRIRCLKLSSQIDAGPTYVVRTYVAGMESISIPATRCDVAAINHT